MRFAAEVMLERRGFPALRQASCETRALDSASWHCNNAETRVSTLASLVLAVMSRRGFQPSHLGAALMAMTSPASGVWILLFDDLSSVFLDSLHLRRQRPYLNLPFAYTTSKTREIGIGFLEI